MSTSLNQGPTAQKEAGSAGSVTVTRLQSGTHFWAVLSHSAVFSYGTAGRPTGKSYTV